MALDERPSPLNCSAHSAGAPAASRASAGATRIRSRCRAPPRPWPAAWCSSAMPRRRCTRWPARASTSGCAMPRRWPRCWPRAAGGARTSPSCWCASPRGAPKIASGVTRFTDSLVKLFGSDAAGSRRGAQFRPAVVRPESGRQARAVARQLGLRRPHAATRARPAARMNADYEVVGGRRRARSASPPPCCSRGNAASRRRAYRRARPAHPDGGRARARLPVDLRVFALSRASEKILRAADAWNDIRARARHAPTSACRCGMPTCRRMAVTRWCSTPRKWASATWA